MTADVKATGLQSLRPGLLGFLGMGLMVECLKQQGTSHSSRDLLKICVKMEANWSAQTFRHAGEIPSGPEFFLDFCFLKTWSHILHRL